MAVQTSYGYDYPVGFEGQLADINDNELVTGVLEGAANIPFGCALKKGTSDDGYVTPSAGADIVEGISVHSHSRDNFQFSGLSPSDAGVKPGQNFNVMRRGNLYVKVEQAVVAHDPVYSRFTLGSFTALDQPGGFRKDVDTLVAWAITTAYTLGQRRVNGGNLYEVITAGTSAGAGGPTTTAADIVDGTVHWKYLAAGAAGASAALIKGAKYLTSAAAGGIAKVAYNAPAAAT